MLKILPESKTSSSKPKLNLKTILKEFLIFPIVAVIMGIATVIVILLVFPVWLFKEHNPHTR